MAQDHKIKLDDVPGMVEVIKQCGTLCSQAARLVAINFPKPMSDSTPMTEWKEARDKVENTVEVLTVVAKEILTQLTKSKSKPKSKNDGQGTSLGVRATPTKVKAVKAVRSRGDATGTPSHVKIEVLDE